MCAHDAIGVCRDCDRCTWHRWFRNICTYLHQRTDLFVFSDVGDLESGSAPLLYLEMDEVVGLMVFVISMVIVQWGGTGVKKVAAMTDC